MESVIKNPFVSVCCLTYNHKKYIQFAIEGFLAQKTNFSIEIIIHDDASDDGTTDILKVYQKQYPEQINCIYQQTNLYSQGINPIAYYVLPICRGKYIALCEGDDYWTDPYKLQKQVDILEAHPEYSMCFTARNVVDNKNIFIREEKYPNKIYTTKDVVEGFIPSTQTILLRNYQDLKFFRQRNSSYPSGDRLITYYCSLMGDIYYLDEITACYRESGEGVWSSFNNLEKRHIRFERLKEFYKILGVDKNNLNLIDRGLYEFYSGIKISLKNPLRIFKKIKKLYHNYLRNIPLSLIIAVILMRISSKIMRKFFNKVI